MEFQWPSYYEPIPNEAEAWRRVRAFERSRASRIFEQACDDWVDAYDVCPPLMRIWSLDEHEHDMLTLIWRESDKHGAGLPDGVTPNMALLALSAWCWSRLRTAGVTVDVVQLDDPDDPDDLDEAAHVACRFVIKRRRRAMGKTTPSKGAGRE